MTVFLDTSYLLALVLQDDELHYRALAWKGAMRADFLTTEYVLVEVLDALAQPAHRQLGSGIVHLLRSAPDVRIVPGDTSLLEDGLSLFDSRPDKGWGITDCASFVVMHREGIRDALTHDHDFEQAGYRALLRTDPPATA